MPRKKKRSKKKDSPAKKRRKLNTKDKIFAALAVAVLILAAAVSSLAVIHFHSVRVRNEAAVETETAKNSEPVLELPKVPAKPAPAPVVKPPPAVSPPRPAPAASVPAASVPAAPKPVPAAPVPVASAGGVQERPPAALPPRGVLVFVIDDAGHNLHELEPFLKINGPLTIAVLPGLPYSAEAARRIRAAGKEVFLHQPMEAIGGQNPGPGAIRSGMGRDEIRAIISRNLDEVGPVAGINNHEGSRITMDEDAMEIILALCRERGILFLDSRTTAETAVPAAARRLGMVIGERDVFVDNVQERESMKGFINTGLRKAEQKGSVIMIGHVWSPDLAPLIGELLPDLREKGYSFSPVSKVIGGTTL